jgi:sulfide:quinone oxidoreductase
MRHTAILVVGAGAAGISVAARLRRADETLSITIVEPSFWHYYQPIWTLAGAGEADKRNHRRPMGRVIPTGCEWLQDRVVGLDPGHCRAETESHGTIRYEQLVVAPGLRVEWGRVPGLAESIGTNGVCSNYSYDTCDYTWECIRAHQGGRALFASPSGTSKCGGAAHKIAWLADHKLRQTGVRDNSEVAYVTSGTNFFFIPKYRRTLENLARKRGLDVRYERDLVEVDAERRVARFECADGTREDVEFELLHVAPPQAPPEMIRCSALATGDGFVASDRHTLRHPDYPEVFALGDAASLPTSKTGAAVRKQAPVVARNLLDHRSGRSPSASYDGYSSCPIVTEVGKAMLAEFDYEGQPAESFPFDQARPRYSMYALKAYVLPELYWNGMLEGLI